MTKSNGPGNASKVALPNTHRIVRVSKSGVRIHWYGYRGKGAPRIASYEGKDLAEALRAETKDARNIAARYAELMTPAASMNYMGGLIANYKASPAFTTLAPSTRKIWTIYLDRIQVVFGDMSLRAMGSKGARRLILDWRDGYADRPRSADYGIEVLSRLLSWAVDREYMLKNPAEKIESLYQSDRSDLIWEPHHMEAAEGVASAHVWNAIEVLANSGLRGGDGVALVTDAIDFEAGEINWKTSKSRGRTQADIPLTKALRKVLLRIPHIQEPGRRVLLTSLGTPWSSSNALSHAIGNVAKRAGFKRRMHDLRGTAVTKFRLAGLSNAEVAPIVGWSEADVEKIAKRYVSKGALSRALAKRINAAEEDADADV